CVCKSEASVQQALASPSAIIMISSGVKRVPPLLLGFPEAFQTHKLAIFFLEEKFDRPQGSVPVLGHNKLGDIFLLGLRFVIILPVKETNQIGVLLQR